MVYKNIKLEKKDAVGTIIVNRPQALNALNKHTLIELSAAIDELEHDSTIKVALITGEGKAFIAGADIKEMQDLTPLKAKEFSELGHSVLFKIEHSRLPFIATVNGYALGGGCELMMACDIIYASEKALIGQPEINLGISPGFGGTQRLARLIGISKAKELLLTGDNISAQEALSLGLVNKVFPADTLVAESQKVAQKLASKSGVQLHFIKSLVNKGINIDIASGCALEISYFSSSFSTYDQKEGMHAFSEKRKPIFKNH